MSEETKQSRKIMPRALILSLTISTILYILVALSAVSVVGWEALATSKAPLTEVVAKTVPQATIAMSVIALFATNQKLFKPLSFSIFYPICTTLRRRVNE